MLFIIFHLDEDRYAFPARDVKEILPLVSTKALPGAPPGIVGLVNFRGSAVPVLDLCQLALGRPSAWRVSTRLLIVRYPQPAGGERLLGVMVERATETATFPPEAFRPAGVAVNGARYLGPVARDARGLVQRVEVAALLTDAVRAALFQEGESHAGAGGASTS